MYAIASRYSLSCSCLCQYSNSLHATWCAIHPSLNPVSQSLMPRPQSSPSSVSSLIASLETIRERVSSLSAAHLDTPLAITPSSKSYTRLSLFLPFSCSLFNLWARQLRQILQRVRWSAKTKLACRCRSVVGASVQPNHISCTRSSGASCNTRSCDLVRFFFPICFSTIDPLHSCLRCRDHYTVLRSPVSGKMVATVCGCIHRSYRLCFHLGRPHGFDRLLRPDPGGAPRSSTTSQVPVH
jgi:hypothetical protein